MKPAPLRQIQVKTFEIKREIPPGDPKADGPVMPAEAMSENMHKPADLAVKAEVSSAKEKVVKLVLKECSSCHAGKTVYRPDQMKAASWKKLMAGLNDHFGENAELDEETTKLITDFLVRNSRDRDEKKKEPSAKTPIRIRDQTWFLRSAHSHRKNQNTERSCASCHTKKSQADFMMRAAPKEIPWYIPEWLRNPTLKEGWY